MLWKDSGDSEVFSLLESSSRSFAGPCELAQSQTRLYGIQNSLRGQPKSCVHACPRVLLLAGYHLRCGTGVCIFCQEAAQKKTRRRRKKS